MLCDPAQSMVQRIQAPLLKSQHEHPSHQLSMTVLMSPDMANFSGNVHGGAILKLLDQVAYACASRYAGRYRDAERGPGDVSAAHPRGSW
jgi:acyl-coenzyme A thioesterase PaaI-like protein